MDKYYLDTYFNFIDLNSINKNDLLDMDEYDKCITKDSVEKCFCEDQEGDCDIKNIVANTKQIFFNIKMFKNFDKNITSSLVEKIRDYTNEDIKKILLLLKTHISKDIFDFLENKYSFDKNEYFNHIYSKYPEYSNLVYLFLKAIGGDEKIILRIFKNLQKFNVSEETIKKMECTTDEKSVYAKQNDTKQLTNIRMLFFSILPINDNKNIFLQMMNEINNGILKINPYFNEINCVASRTKKILEIMQNTKFDIDNNYTIDDTDYVKLRKLLNDILLQHTIFINKEDDIGEISIYKNEQIAGYYKKYLKYPTKGNLSYKDKYLKYKKKYLELKKQFQNN